MSSVAELIDACRPASYYLSLDTPQKRFWAAFLADQGKFASEKTLDYRKDRFDLNDQDMKEVADGLNKLGYSMATSCELTEHRNYYGEIWGAPIPLIVISPHRDFLIKNNYHLYPVEK